MLEGGPRQPDVRQLSIFIGLSACQSASEKVGVTIVAALARLLRPSRGFQIFPSSRLWGNFLAAVGKAGKSWHFMGFTPGSADLGPTDSCAVSKAGQGAERPPPP